MQEATRKYYIGDDDEAAQLAAEFFARREKMFDAIADIREYTGATAIMITSRDRLTHLAFDCATPRAGVISYRAFECPNLKRVIQIARLDMRTKRGKEIAKMLEAGSLKRDASDTILHHYQAHRHTPQRGAIAVSVGFPLPDKKRIVLSVPDREDDPFIPHSGLREIAKSEYVYLTEEFKPEKP